MARTGGLIVKGGWDKDMGDTLAGSYLPTNQNHNRAVYKRVDPPEDQVLLYYWDERDGEEQKGWWFGPEVGGEEVWAHNNASDGTPLPPSRGWTILHNGAVDPMLTVTRTDSGPVPKQSVPPPRGSVGSAQAPGPSSAASGYGSSSSSARPPVPTPPPRAAAHQESWNGGAKPPSVPSNGPKPGPGPPQPSGAKRSRPPVDDSRAEDLRKWLELLDDGAGAMLSYFDVLAAEFDADLNQIAAAKVEGGERRGILGAVDPSFWETVKVQKTGHKMLFARGIAKL